jgi:magnesium-transporting ATPase (P-type)
MKRTLIAILSSSLVAITLFTAKAWAAPYKLIVPLPGSTPQAPTTPGGYLKMIYTFGLGFGALLAMVMIVVGAVQYTASEAVTSKEDAKDRIQKAVIGLILLIAATLILNIINPELPLLNEPGTTQTP